MTLVAVTGASGKAGRAVVRDLLEHGYEVRAIDIAPAPADLGVDVLTADLTDYGQAVQSLDGCDTVVHLANIPAPGRKPDAVTFNTNITMNYAVFTAAVHLRADRVVWASSETTLGLPFDTPPRYAPIDEAHYPYPTTAYALSKVASETIAEQIAAWSGRPFIALRLSNIHAVPDYAKVPSYWADPRSRRWNAWGYIDERDVALACRLALTADVAGAVALIIAAADTIMDRPSADLLAEVYPQTEVRKQLSTYETLLSIDKAREVLGFEPQHSWRDEVKPA
ncbi:MAG TPA: NAD(P)-dependent oxidoreductase [Actinoplanes sp.]|jgi:nucleoside-diphosphate-sugar epimerase|nr:NAD(P)-dependent oxidoreductase [Actinoplanes sp.]